MNWVKSSYSGGEGNCVEVAPLPSGAAVRDSKDKDGGELHFAAGDWRRFLADMKAGRHTV